MIRASDLNMLDVLAKLGIVPQRIGREVWACCPFHQEFVASWRIRNEPSSELHGQWQCFGKCSVRHGGIADLVRRFLDLETIGDAWRWLAGEIIVAPRRIPSRIEIGEPKPHLPGQEVAIPIGVRLDTSDAWPKHAREYMTETRAIPGWQLDKWAFGYALEGAFAGRIFIPLHDDKGILRNFTARTFVDSPLRFKEPEKWRGADKSAVFGERFWPAPDERGTVVLTEGALDALAVERVCEGAYVGAIFGSEVLPGHLLRISTFSTVLVASNPDAAGDKYWHAIKHQLGRHCKVGRIEIPQGEDCASLAAKAQGGRVLHRAIDRAYRRTTD